MFRSKCCIFFPEVGETDLKTIVDRNHPEAYTVYVTDA